MKKPIRKLIEDPWGFNQSKTSKKISIFTPVPKNVFSKRTLIQPTKNPYDFSPKKYTNNFLIDNKKVVKKDMNWIQAKSKHPELNPFIDSDKDGLMNMYDCKPFDKNKQDELSKFTKRNLRKLSLTANPKRAGAIKRSISQKLKDRKMISGIPKEQVREVILSEISKIYKPESEEFSAGKKAGMEKQKTINRFKRKQKKETARFRDIKQYALYRAKLERPLNSQVDLVVKQEIIPKLKRDADFEKNLKTYYKILPKVLNKIPSEKINSQYIDELTNKDEINKVIRKIERENLRIIENKKIINQTLASKESEETKSEYRLLAKDQLDENKELIKYAKGRIKEFGKYKTDETRQRRRIRKYFNADELYTPEGKKYMERKEYEPFEVLKEGRNFPLFKSDVVKNRTASEILSSIGGVGITIDKQKLLKEYKIQDSYPVRLPEEKLVKKMDFVITTQPYITKPKKGMDYPEKIKIPTEGLTAKQLEKKIKIKTEVETNLVPKPKTLIERGEELIERVKEIKEKEPKQIIEDVFFEKQYKPEAEKYVEETPIDYEPIEDDKNLKDDIKVKIKEEPQMKEEKTYKEKKAIKEIKEMIPELELNEKE